MIQILKAVCLCCLCTDLRQIICSEVDFFDNLITDFEGDTRQFQISLFIIIELQIQVDLFSRNRQRLGSCEAVDADCFDGAYPNRSCYGFVSVFLFYANVIIGVVVRNLKSQSAFVCIYTLTVENDSAVGDDADLSNLSIRSVAEVYLDSDGRSRSTFFENRTHDEVVQRVINHQIVIFRCIHSVALKRVIDIGSGQ